jgi:hypothetical protein
MIILALLFALTSIRNWIRRFSPRLTDTLFDSLVFITVLFSLFVQIKINSDSHATPYRQRIRSASAQVYVVIQREGSDDSFYKSERSYLIFRKGNETLLTTAAYGAIETQEGNGRTRVSSMLDMDANDPAIGHHVSELQKSEFVQIQFVQMPKNAHVIEGRAVITVNSMVQLEIKIPAQSPKDGLIFVRDIAPIFRNFR